MTYSWNEALKLAGSDNLSPVPPLVKVVYAYADGKVEQFDNEFEAKHFSNNIEVKWIDTPERIDAIASHRLVNETAFNIWYKSLRDYWRDLSDDLFNICYNEAYDRGHSYGYDEVASYMHDVVSFAKKVLKVK